MIKVIDSKKSRIKRRKRIRAKISGTADRPRLSIFKSNCHLYIQAIDDIEGRTLVAVSNLEKDLLEVKPPVEGAKKLGQIAGERLKEKNIGTGVKLLLFPKKSNNPIIKFSLYFTNYQLISI